MKRIVIALLFLAVPLAFLAAWPEEKGQAGGTTNAITVVHGFGTSPIKGVVRFTATDDGVVIRGEITGLMPGKHAFHIHEFGDVTDGKCSGGHFNPEKKKHGGPDSAERHVGDLGNITADETGKAVIDMKDKQVALSGSHSIIGRAVIIHAKADDLKSDPAGNAGDRIAGGVVGIANPMEKH